MTSAFQYSPNPFQPLPLYQWGNTTPITTPFIPRTPLAPISLSPYRDYAELPGEPESPNTRRVHWEDEVLPRRRTLSFNEDPRFLQAPAPIGHVRTLSSGDMARPPVVWPTPVIAAAPTWTPSTPSALFLPPILPAPFQIHPFLDGQNPRTDFLFDLSRPNFLPLRYKSTVFSPTIAPIKVSQDDLAQPATHPPVAKMRIVCDRFPHWPIEIALNPADAQHILQSGGVIPPIRLGEVLFAIHQMLHKQISPADWGKLNISEQDAVSRAFYRRIKLNPAEYQTQYTQGVKRVDYLLDKYIFKGLIRSFHDQGYENWKLIV